MLQNILVVKSILSHEFFEAITMLEVLIYLCRIHQLRFLSHPMLPPIFLSQYFSYTESAILAWESHIGMTRFPGILDSIKNQIHKFERNFKLNDPLSELLKQFHCFHCNLVSHSTTYVICLIPILPPTSSLLNSMEDFSPCLIFIHLHYSILLTTP